MTMTTPDAVVDALRTQVDALAAELGRLHEELALSAALVDQIGKDTSAIDALKDAVVRAAQAVDACMFAWLDASQLPAYPTIERLNAALAALDATSPREDKS